MHKAKLLMVAFLFVLGGCAAVPSPPSPPDVYVMRHLHTPAGATNPDLTSEGQRQALLLVERLRRAQLAVIYVSSTQRAQQTAEPLAKTLGLIPKIYNPADTPALVAAASAEPGTVLVVGHSNTVPEIIERLGGQRPAPMVHEDFGDLWRIDGKTHATTRVRIDE